MGEAALEFAKRQVRRLAAVASVGMTLLLGVAVAQAAPASQPAGHGGRMPVHAAPSTHADGIGRRPAPKPVLSSHGGGDRGHKVA